jgi:hypothetical protein
VNPRPTRDGSRWWIAILTYRWHWEQQVTGGAVWLYWYLCNTGWEFNVNPPNMLHKLLCFLSSSTCYRMMRRGRSLIPPLTLTHWIDIMYVSSRYVIGKKPRSG